ncbi:EARLY-PHYTOCHROME-RESPONSIVE1 family protein [Hibiscus syriacus]|uniref:EARLY-PHYTOCHROME-RESPONSIVE1 family protein n=1 Tax=Hibiscus syriacus TaxID=106335 RepID=A0A6A3B2A6_HIBSY|nr:uncharacterized protein LOC120118707 [Hibiscus syriacus]KAE8710018.1 EARLY-PHYTOCHROME-RESPONSIVE1 family protein [Hibiscus syriacus]
MGKLSHELHIQHFSHPHPLELALNPQTLNPSPCSACKLQSSGWMYTCKPCNFTLHASCSQLPRLITHPCHPGHSLGLLPAPSYPVGYFNCDGCGQRGYGFNYHCNQCEFDIHSLCASKPLAIRCGSHPCQLQLFFYPPYQTKGFSCDVCHQIGSNHWLYRCSICEFDVHMSCVNNSTTASSAGTYTNPYRTTSTASAYTSTPRQGNVQIQGWNSFPGSVQSNNLQYGNGAAAPMNNQCYNSQNNGAPAGNDLMGVAIQGFVEGAAQQVGQNFVQSLMDGGGDSNDGGDNGGYE